MGLHQNLFCLRDRRKSGLACQTTLPRVGTAKPAICVRQAALGTQQREHTLV